MPADIDVIEASRNYESFQTADGGMTSSCRVLLNDGSGRFITEMKLTTFINSGRILAAAPADMIDGDGGEQLCALPPSVV